ncbi:hypothetical protein NSPZN2_100029 [Nitrospira defluvii]|uniref:Uncharacterized protein n=1 Tax=Nitrospira defluvii TaxID=330214 RepID=A0ABM8QZA7_9BACT|nr:hypothetical protein NSPZN2_100029 [Nitrospira defluvii]
MRRESPLLDPDAVGRLAWPVFLRLTRPAAPAEATRIPGGHYEAGVTLSLTRRHVLQPDQECAPQTFSV